MEETTRTLLPRIVLIACGCFSPPTPLHLRLFELAKDYFESSGTHQVIGGIVSPTHDGYGKKGLVSSIHRCEMLRLALRSSNWIRLSDWESKQQKWLRTESVLQYHHNYMNNYLNSLDDLENMNAGDQCASTDWLPNKLTERRDRVGVKLLCGADLLESFNVPGLWSNEDIENIIMNHGLVVVSRSGSNPERLIFESDILSKCQRNITLITNWVTNDISSTIIRKLINRGKSVKYLIDDLVYDYIEHHQLFRSTEFILKVESPLESDDYNVAFYDNQMKTEKQSHGNNGTKLQIPPIEMQTSSDEVSPSDDIQDDEGQRQHPMLQECTMSSVEQGAEYPVQSTNTLGCERKELMKRLMGSVRTMPTPIYGPEQTVQMFSHNVVQDPDDTDQDAPSISEEIEAKKMKMNI